MWMANPDKTGNWQDSTSDPNASTDGVDGASTDPNTATPTSVDPGASTGVGQTLGPVLDVDTRELRFGTSLNELTFRIRNVGGGALVYNLSVNVPWAVITPTSGQSIGESDVVTVRVARTGLPSREYTGSVTILAGGGASAAVALYMSVGGTRSAILQVSPEQVDFARGPAQATLTLQNTGGGSLAYTLTADAAWLRLGSTSGALEAGQTNAVVLTADRSQLNVGVHESRVRVLSGTSELGTVLVRVDKPVTAPLIVPWIECNGNTPAEVDVAVAQAAPWHLVTDTVIVSTQTNKASIYPQLRTRLGMRVIPGYKTSAVLGTGNFAAPAGWQQIAADVATAVALSGETTVIFEHESAVLSYLEGTATLDLAQLRQSLGYLPRTVSYLWYPGITWPAPGPKRDRAFALDAVAGEVLQCRFLDHSYAHPAWPTFTDWINARRDLQSLTPQPNVPICWTYCCDGFCYWDPTQIGTILQLLTSYSEVVIYPGGQLSAQTAAAMNQVLWPAP